MSDTAEPRCEVHNMTMRETSPGAWECERCINGTTDKRCRICGDDEVYMEPSLSKKPVVYLAGPIANTNTGTAFVWREYATRQLNDRGIETRSPMRAKHELCHDNIGTDYRAYASRGWAYTPAGILTRDHNDCVTSDGVLVNMLGAKSMSFGTGMEIAWCYDRHIPTVVAIEESFNPHDGHPMFVAAVKFRLANLDDAIDAIAVILNR